MATVIGMLEEWAAGWSAHDMSRVCALFTDDCVYEDVTMAVVNYGKADLRQFGEGFFVAMPDVKFSLDWRVAADDRAAAEWTMVGTQAGDLPGLPATGKRCSVRGASAFEVRDGLFSRCSDYWDMMTFLKQLGHAT
jgi:steroid delta-isomerase-like uncharacterized protein